MEARRELLKKLAFITSTRTQAHTFDGTEGSAFAGETCIETRNTIYRLRDGVCFAVLSRDRRKRQRASALVGMKMAWWLVTSGPGGARLSPAWELGACAVLWKPGATEDADGALALTSPTTDFTRGLTAERLQAFHDAAPPQDSALYRRSAPPAPPQSRADTASMTRVHPEEAQRLIGLARPPRPTLPSHSTGT
jgi:hypothetical protein